MKISAFITTFAAVASLGACLSVGATSASAASAVCFYEHEDFDGLALCVKGEAEVPAIRLDFNDKISSITIKDGWEVEACQHANFQGWCKRYSGDVQNIGQSANDQISSYRVVRADDDEDSAEACFYEHANFQGRKFCLQPGDNWDAASDASWNDLISSVKISHGLKVTAYEHTDRGGERLKLRRDTDFVSEEWNDRISSIKVR